MYTIFFKHRGKTTFVIKINRLYFIGIITNTKESELLFNNGRLIVKNWGKLLFSLFLKMK